MIDNIKDEDSDYEELEEEETSSSMPVEDYVPQCIVCNRVESSKIRLFRWPKNDGLRMRWLTFFRMEIPVTYHDMLICSFHFAAETFIMVGEKVFWKASAMPVYRFRRPCVTTPFPWEDGDPNVQTKPELVHYKLRFRMPYSRRKEKAQHPVAVLSPANNPTIFYEFSFNRLSKDSTRKFYYCLNCKKAKSQSNIRDVVKTIQMDGTKILSRTDPFQGHHFACRPISIIDTRISSWQDVNCPTSSANGQFIFIDENEVDPQWEDTGYPVIVAAEPATIEEPPILSAEMAPVPKKKQKLILKCHVCPVKGFSSTEQFVGHLQRHLDGEKSCRGCGIRISIDDSPRLQRIETCSKCLRIGPE